MSKALFNTQCRKKMVLKLGDIPSIPCQRSAFGYEEGPNGTLVQQASLEKTFSGLPHDAVGPGQYNVVSAAVKARGGNWHVSTTQRSGLGAARAFQNSLGPGSYDISNLQTLNAFNTRGTSCFISNAQKSTVLKDMGSSDEGSRTLPGPGQYNPRTGAFEQRQSSGAVQSFGIVSPRFGREKSNVGANVGPRKYGDFRQAYVLCLLMNRK